MREPQVFRGLLTLCATLGLHTAQAVLELDLCSLKLCKRRGKVLDFFIQLFLDGRELLSTQLVEAHCGDGQLGDEKIWFDHIISPPCCWAPPDMLSDHV